jgi:hypothetical protein
MTCGSRGLHTISPTPPAGTSSSLSFRDPRLVECVPELATAIWRYALVERAEAQVPYILETVHVVRTQPKALLESISVDRERSAPSDPEPVPCVLLVALAVPEYLQTRSSPCASAGDRSLRQTRTTRTRFGSRR